MSRKKMSYVRGDTHGERAVWTAPAYGIGQTLKEGDILIICGDFGYVGKEEELDAMEKLPYLILFCDGNHEYFEELNRYPVEVWNGGKVHRIRKNVLHLMRGQIFDIEGHRYFVMGGGFTKDREYLPKGIAWWEEEMPSEEEMDEARKNLEAANYQVDYIITHAAPLKTIERLRMRPILQELPLNQFLQWVQEHVQYRHWYFGHLHLDAETWKNQTAVWTDLRKIETNECMNDLWGNG